MYKIALFAFGLSVVLSSAPASAFNYTGAKCDWDSSQSIPGDVVILQNREIIYQWASRTGKPVPPVVYVAKGGVLGLFDPRDRDKTSEAACPRELVKTAGKLVFTYACLTGERGPKLQWKTWATGSLIVDAQTGSGAFVAEILDVSTSASSGVKVKNCELYRDDGHTEQFGQIIR